ncbi:MAG: hypothetical protein NTZ85_06200 [Bacteroidia bacterium]|nr:hypothetical protein [Bacteroidia bacterium]
MDELIIKKFVEIAEGYRHPNYKRTCDKADTYKKLYTGEDMNSLMRRFDMREDTERFEQRLLITQHITSTVMRNLAKPQYKIPRANNIQRIITFANSNTKDDQLEKILGKFWGKKSLDKYMATRWIELNNVDPNLFLVLEWAAFDNTKEKASPYPYEVYSKNVMDFKYINETLEYLVTFGTVEVLDEYKQKILTEKYTYYGKNQTFTCTEMPELLNQAREIPVEIADGWLVLILKRNKTFLIQEIIPHNLGFVPAERIGWNRDIQTDGVTMISPLDDAIPILMKLVKANSELDLTMALHAFPQKVQYSKKCPADNCVGGNLPDGSTCPRCHGDGVEVHKTAQDVINLNMPDTKEELIDLDNIIRYVSPPVDLVKFQDVYVQRLAAWCKEAIYNTEVFSKKEISETATGKNIDLQNVYDALYPMADAYSEFWKFMVTTIAKIVSLDKGLVCDFIFSKDFKMKSLSDLYMDLKLAADSRADSFIKDTISEDIARIMYHDNPVELSKILTKKMFFPFSGKTQEEINLSLESENVPEEIKTLYFNYGWIFDEIASEEAQKGNNFWTFERNEQKKLIDAKIATLIVKNKEAKKQTQAEDSSDIPYEKFKKNIETMLKTQEKPIDLAQKEEEI